jgi:hypothetical protein
VTEALRELLDGNGLGEHKDAFERHKILGLDIAAELAEADLEKIGVEALGDRKRLLKLFAAAKPQAAPAPVEAVARHSIQAGEDAKAGFGRGFGEAVGEKAGGCFWGAAVVILIGVVIALVIASL